MARHPYEDLPDSAYWRSAVANVRSEELDPVVTAPFRIAAANRVVAAGSCFAQDIGRYLKAAGCAYLVTEPAHPIVTPQAAALTGYGVFSARYGNVYTARQLVQLFDRAYGRFQPVEDIWRERAGLFLDPFRPNIQPRGFNSEKEFRLDRARHFHCVREAFEQLDVFIFTLGLTEAWRSREDGAVFPVCPGASGGVFSAQRHEFVNFGVEDVVADFREFVARLRSVNPRARIILTVSPVPLVATAENRHVLVSTVYSKSVLRVACDMLARSIDNLAYFPAYEIVASGAAGSYFAADKRSVTAEGVAHVMRVFSRHYLADAGENVSLVGKLRRKVGALRGGGRVAAGADTIAIEAALQAMCDEEALDPAFVAARSAEGR